MPRSFDLSCIDLDVPSLSSTVLRGRPLHERTVEVDLQDLSARLLSAQPSERPGLLLATVLPGRDAEPIDPSVHGDGVRWPVAFLGGGLIRLESRQVRGHGWVRIDLTRLGAGRPDDLRAIVDLILTFGGGLDRRMPQSSIEDVALASQAIERLAQRIALWVEGVVAPPPHPDGPLSVLSPDGPARAVHRLVRAAIAILASLSVEARRLQRVERAVRIELPSGWPDAMARLRSGCVDVEEEAGKVTAMRGLLDAAEIGWLEGLDIEPPTYERLLDAILDVDGIPVDLGNLAPTEIGTLHEALMGFTIDVGDDGVPRFARSDGSSRSEGGVFYTPTALVDEILDEALEPVVEQRLEAAGKPEGLLDLTICDPACGAGNFLVAAAGRLASRFVPVASHEDAIALRIEVVRRCIHGADRDEFAVRLATLSLRLFCDPAGVRTPSLEGNLVVGDSLIGAWPDDLVKASHVAESAATSGQASLFDGAEAGPLLAPSYDRAGADAWCVDGLGSEAGDARQFLHWPLAFPHLIRQGEDALFDVVVGNPPYVRGRDHAKSDPAGRRFISSHRPACQGGQWNLFVPFVALAARLARKRSCMLVQSSVLGSQYAGALHEHLLRAGTVVACLDFSDVPGLFPSAAVQVAALVVAPGRPTPTRFVRYAAGLARGVEVEVSRGQLEALPSGYWTLPTSGIPEQERDLLTAATLRLGDIATVRDGMEQSQAYEVVPLVREATGAAGELQLVPTGLIDPFRLRWGERPVRFLGQSLARPVLVESDLRSAGFHRMADQGLAEKIAIAGLSSRLEACVDEGASVVSKSAFEIRLDDPDVCPYAVSVVLNSALMNRLYDAAFGALGFGAGSHNYRPPTLAALPLPDRSALRRHDAEASQPGTHLSELGRELHATAPTDTRFGALLETAEAEVARAFGVRDASTATE